MIPPVTLLRTLTLTITITCCRYSQFDPAVLEYHLLLSHAAGTDGFIVNVNPRSEEQVEIVTLLAEVAARCTKEWPGWFDQKLVISYDDVLAESSKEVHANVQLLHDNWCGA
jgi:hypothetical protein